MEGKNQNSSDNAKPVRKEEPSEEFDIAADLTLYPNPLRVLQKREATSSKPATDKKPEEGHGGKNDFIAADLTKYNCPLEEKFKLK